MVHAMQVASLQGLSSSNASTSQLPAASKEPSQAQANLQQLSQSIAEALQEPFGSAASPSLQSIIPGCMTDMSDQQTQASTHIVAAQPVSMAPAPMEKQSSSPSDLLLPSVAPQPQQHRHPQQELSTGPSSAPEQPTSWLAWEHQLHSQEAGPSCPQLADEYMHPHTQWLLKQPLASYVLDPRPVVLKHVKQTASGGLVTGSAAASGSPSGDAIGPTGDLEADTATQQASPEAQTPGPSDMPIATGENMQSGFPSVPSRGQLSRLGQEDGHQQIANQHKPGYALLAEHATPALSGFSASQPALGDMPTESEPFTPALSAAPQQLLARQNSSAVAGPAKSSSRPLGRQRNSVNYSLLAGNRKMDAKAGSGLLKGAKKGLNKNSPVPQAEVRKDQAALSVAAAIAEGQSAKLNLGAKWQCAALCNARSQHGVCEGTQAVISLQRHDVAASPDVCLRV